MKEIVSVITGGHGGMGAAIAKELGRDSILVLASRDAEALKKAQLELAYMGYETYAVPTDIRNADAVKALAAFSVSLGQVMRVIHTAGVSPADTPADEILDTNVFGTVHMTETFFPLLAEGGVMINFASLAAHTIEAPDEWFEVFDGYSDAAFYSNLQEQIEPFNSDAFACAGMAYCLSKRFVIYYSQKNTVRFAQKGCRILSISPGSYMTPMHQALLDNQPETAQMQLDSIPFGRWGRPYEIAGLVSFLCSTSAGYLSGIDILTDGGQIANTFVGQLG